MVLVNTEVGLNARQFLAVTVSGKAKEQNQKTKNMIIRNKIQDYFIDSLRVILLLLILFLIFYHDWNINASIIFGLIAFAALAFSSKTYIELDSEKIKIVTKRLFKIFNKSTEYDRNKILNIEYIPSRIHPIILILPGVGGIKSAKLKITMTNGKSEEILMALKNTDLEILNDINRKGKIKPSR